MTPTDPSQLHHFSEALAAAVERAGRSVVALDVRRWPTSGIAFSADGLIVAANHAIERDEELSVFTGDGGKAKATLLGRDGTLDLAVLKVEMNLEAPTWVAASELKVGQLALGLYRPGNKVRARLGVVEGLDEGFHTPWGGRVDASIDVDLSTRNLSAITFANAEGALFAFGVAGPRGRGLTLPESTLRRVVDDIVKHGRVQRGYVGVRTQVAAVPAAQQETAGAERGLLVIAVEPGSPAERAGLSMGDLLLFAGGKALEDVGELLAALSEGGPGKRLELSILRTGKVHALTLDVGARP